jgi:hypothetical protein
VSASQYRSQLERKRRQRVDAEKKAGEFRKKEADKRTAATKARASASRSSSSTVIASKLREAGRYEDEANRAGQEVARWQTKAAGYSKEEADLQGRLTKAELTENAAAERRRNRDRQVAERAAAAERTQYEHRLSAAENRVDLAVRELRAPKPEKLRILMLAASSEGDLRLGREQKRIRAAVESALHRDLIEFDMRPSATPSDLLDGISKFRPHIVHFSGHSDEDLVVFEDDVDEQHEGVIVKAATFARAVAATDDPPLLILLNSCHSAGQIDNLVAQVAPFAIGMADEIGDGDAITYSTQFYAAVANGQSIQSAHLSGQVAVELAGLPGHELPVLAHAEDVDPGSTCLVTPPE